MAAHRINPQRIKQHRSYAVTDLADCLDVHKNTVREWQRNGLEPSDAGRPTLFQGATVRAFLAKRRASRKRPCGAGTLYCFRCREPRKPVLGMVDYLPLKPDSGNLRAMCEHCEGLIYRRARKGDLARIMPGITVQFTQGQPRLSGSTSPSLNCDKERHG